MKFLADESCDYGVIVALRRAGHNVLAIVQVMPGADDSRVIRLAADQGRFLLTEDKDFGRLVFAHGFKVKGVIFIRYPENERGQLVRDFLRLIKSYLKKLAGHFIVLEPRKIRFTRLD